MLHSLSVSNYILIGSLDTTFPEGLIIITGETGAGKSILLGALSLVLGAKADASMVGPQGENCVVEAEFSIDDEVKAFLKENDIPTDGDTLVLRRVVGKSGRSRCFAGDEPVSVSILQELSSRLIDIHSQHQTLLLGDERFRMEALDLYAGCMELRERCSATWSQVLTLRRELSALQERRAQALRDREYNQTRWEKLDQAHLVPGEIEELEAEQKQLAHAEDIKETLCSVLALVGGDEDDSLSQRLLLAGRQLEKASRFIPSLEDLAKRLSSARLEIDDIAAEIDTLNSRTEASPQRLQQIDERLSLLYGLLQRHGAASVDELIAAREELHALLEDAESLSGEESALEKELEKAVNKHLELCAQLHELRQQKAPAFAQSIQAQLQALELDHSVFAVELQPVSAGANGMDSVQFLFSSTGKAPADVSRMASGGELSRIMLSLKATMARFKHMPTLVFDEIDTGVSGSVADKMGSLVCSMGENMQVFAITHLPQVAAKGHAHYLVSKTSDVTSVRVLDAEQRVQEIARMLSGATITPAAVANARSLLSV